MQTCPTLSVIIEKDHPDVPTPIYATDGSMAFDLTAWFPDTDGAQPDGIMLNPGERHPFNTGIKVQLPPGYGLFMNVRSGLGAKHGIQLVNNQGWIDSDYRGNVIACLLNTGNMKRLIDHKERIVQCVVLPVPRCHFIVGKVNDTVRGVGGFGSTGS